MVVVSSWVELDGGASSKEALVVCTSNGGIHEKEGEQYRSGADDRFPLMAMAKLASTHKQASLGEVRIIYNSPPLCTARAISTVVTSHGFYQCSMHFAKPAGKGTKQSILQSIQHGDVECFLETRVLSPALRKRNCPRVSEDEVTRNHAPAM
jgi:hypothetical protein